MNKATFRSLSNELEIKLNNGKTITKTFNSRALFSANKEEKFELVKKYLVGFLELKNVTLAIR